MKTEKQMFLMKLIEEYANAVSYYECSARKEVQLSQRKK